MAYSQTTLQVFIDQIGELMDDPNHVYWTVPEITLAVYEGLQVWGATTNYWRERGAFQVANTDSTPYYDLSQRLANLRTRTWQYDQMLNSIQYSILESANGITGAGMSQQVTLESLQIAIQVARNRFVLDTRLPLTVVPDLCHPVPGGTGTVGYPEENVLVHRVMFQDYVTSLWNVIWRDDLWAADHSNVDWSTEPGVPVVFSEAENAPLSLQLVPPPANAGQLDGLCVQSLLVDTSTPVTLFGIPDEWIHAVKYAALSYLLAGEGQIKDMVRADYCEKRYQQAIQLAKDARSVIRVTVNNKALPLDAIVNLDSSIPNWRNQRSAPYAAAALYDILCIPPVDNTYGISVDVVRSAPLPNLAQFIDLGYEDLDHLTDYVSHILTLKCGGNEFKSTLSSYDSFMSAVAMRGAVNKAKIIYLEPLLGQPQTEWAKRPDRIEQQV